MRRAVLNVNGVSRLRLRGGARPVRHIVGGGIPTTSWQVLPPSSVHMGALSSLSRRPFSDKKTGAEEEITSAELAPLTPGEKVVAGTRLLMWSGIAVFATACAYYIGRELLPTKMSPNSVFDGAFNLIKNNPEVQRRFGEPLKAYGRDHGGHREGRRNFIEHTEYTDASDQSKRLRIRFNLEGPHGNAFVFAEVSSAMPSGEFVYLLVQDKRNGRVTTLVDNRAALAAQRMAGGNKEGMAVMDNLLRKK